MDERGLLSDLVQSAYYKTQQQYTHTNINERKRDTVGYKCYYSGNSEARRGELVMASAAAGRSSLSSSRLTCRPVDHSIHRIHRIDCIFAFFLFFSFIRSIHRVHLPLQTSTTSNAQQLVDSRVSFFLSFWLSMHDETASSPTEASFSLHFLNRPPRRVLFYVYCRC